MLLMSPRLLPTIIKVLTITALPNIIMFCFAIIQSIDDIIFGLRSAIDKNYKCEIFNLGNNKTVKLMDFINQIENELGINAKIDFEEMQAGDMKETYAEINKSIDMLSFKPKTSINVGLKKFINWYKDYYFSQNKEKNS